LTEIGQQNEMPSPNKISEKGYILVAAGKEKDVERLRSLAKRSNKKAATGFI